MFTHIRIAKNTNKQKTLKIPNSAISYSPQQKIQTAICSKMFMHQKINRKTPFQFQEPLLRTVTNNPNEELIFDPKNQAEFWAINGLMLLDSANKKTS